MRQRFLLIALLAFGLVSYFDGEAVATDCRHCGQHYYYEQPITFVRHPIVVPTPYYVNEYIPCGEGALVNEGQYQTTASLIPRPRCFNSYRPPMYFK